MLFHDRQEIERKEEDEKKGGKELQIKRKLKKKEKVFRPIPVEGDYFVPRRVLQLNASGSNSRGVLNLYRRSVSSMLKGT